MSDIATAFADEVVTNAYTKIISVPGIEGPFALITLDNGFDHTKPSSFGPGGLAAFDAALDEAFAANPVAIAVTGKPFIFAAGADLKGVPAITSREQGLELGRLGHKVFRRCVSRPFPRSPSSTVSLWVAASRSDCTATTARLPPMRAHWVFRKLSSVWSPVGAVRSCSLTWSARRTPSPW